jgi:formylglycine-generating enzyme required for sulfatase activity
MKNCPICQQAYSDDTEYCARDGARLSGAVRDERDCPFCAERILKKARVCRYCGRDVEPLVAPATAAPTPLPAPAETIAEPPYQRAPERMPAATPSAPPAPAKPPQFEIISEGPSKMKSLLIAAAGLAVVVAAALYFSHRGATKGEVRDNSRDGLKYIWIPPGTFTMGCSPSDNECYDFEKPPHQVAISEGFWLGQTDVTVGAYKRFAGATGRQMPPEPNLDGRPLNPGWGEETLPMVDVTWDDAQAYCSWVGGRLPTEAEWEYAARAGSTTARYGDLDAIAWYAENSGYQHLDSLEIWKKGDQATFLKFMNENGNNMHAVGQKHPNDLGLFDMLGNVWEWVNDWWDEGFYQNSPPQDPVGTASGTERLMRGGSWLGRPRDIRVSLRSRRNPGDKDYDLGFRCGGDVSGL